MTAVDKQSRGEGEASMPALWGERAPVQFDQAIPWWIKLVVMAVLILLGIFFVDQRLAVWARGHPIPDLGYRAAAAPLGEVTPKGGDVVRELMWLEQWGQGVCSVVVIAAVALLDKAGLRRAMAIAIGCLATLAVTHLSKDLIGRSRPFVGVLDGWGADGEWRWGGPAMGFTKGAAWGAFPSAHTSAAFALAAGLSWFYPRGRGLFVGLALITAGERVLHAAHYFSDVVAGLTVGVIVTRATLHGKWAGRVIGALPAAAREWWLRDRG